MTNPKQFVSSENRDNKEPNSFGRNLIFVKKASGDEEPFAIDKLERSLQNAGASTVAIEKILVNIEDWIFNGVTTKQIYSRAFSILRREKNTSAMRYRLKKAIMELGPTGYPFEQFIGQLFKKQEFEIEVGVVVEGVCVTHEMDVIATRNKEQHLVECKYHKDQGKHVSVQVPLYVRSRVNDIIEKRKDMPEYKNLSFTGWVVTNTRFSPDSVQYGTRSGLHLLGWDYPRNRGLKEIIEELRLYPVTILSNLTKKEKQDLMDRNILTCLQLKENFHLLDSFALSEKRQKSLKNELTHVCG
ncbi:restriction endonuclease [Labilibaculum sp.]|uniref:restriction endonuclease n=1 Tax=Labilibaculum sp. TaxID=2060723 RepID=UPI002AA80EDE|nr:restriction endonuclease [Labilibaculum sp.]MBN2598078.1 restriction endonuclease [Marinifilaceae bacterium]